MSAGCFAKDGSLIMPKIVGGTWDKNACFTIGGYKFGPESALEINPAYPCGPMTTCDGTKIPSTQVNGKVCGAGNKEFICAGSANGGAWMEMDMPCDEGSVGMCPQACGSMKLCSGLTIPRAKTGTRECGDKNLTYVCGADGNWVVGGSNGAEACVCNTACPEIRACDGAYTSKNIVGKEVCGLDRRLHVCEANLNAPPEWSYGLKCACPGDPPAAQSDPPHARSYTQPPPPASKDNFMLYLFVFIFIIFIILAIVGVVYVRKIARNDNVYQ